MSKRAKKILVLGAFGYSNGQLDGQTVKTQSVYELLQQRYGGGLAYFDTLNRPLGNIVCLIKKLIWCNQIIILPAHRNLTVLFPVLYHLRKILRYQIILICIGGWQIEFFEGIGFKPHKRVLNKCKKIKAFLPEISSVNQWLIARYGFSNTEVFPNFRFLKRAINVPCKTDTLRLVFMARINKKKGYEIIFNLSDYLESRGYDFVIDFYGVIFDEDREHFMQLVEIHSKHTSYNGVLSPDVIQDTLSQYDLLLFPTRYYTEGLPGTIIDSYMAGVPVIATNWKYATDFIDDGETGAIIPFDEPQAYLNKVVEELYMNRKRLEYLKRNVCRKKEMFSDDEAWRVLSKYL